MVGLGRQLITYEYTNVKSGIGRVMWYLGRVTWHINRGIVSDTILRRVLGIFCFKSCLRVVRTLAHFYRIHFYRFSFQNTFENTFETQYHRRAFWFWKYSSLSRICFSFSWKHQSISDNTAQEWTNRTLAVHERSDSPLFSIAR